MMTSTVKKSPKGYYFCSWNNGGNDNHTVIKRGQDEVSEWLRNCLCDIDTGCPVQIVDRLETLDKDILCEPFPIKLSWEADFYSYSITEITDLGALDKHSNVMNKIRIECLTAWNWLKYDRFQSESGRQAQKSLEATLGLQGAIVNE